jgi:mannose-1-phosphate guanylyltransferase
MKLILLSGGSGKRLWPLSNDSRSKQFLKVLSDKNGSPQSMLQRVWNQLSAAGFLESSYIATSKAQVDMILSQLGQQVKTVLEPERRDTFPAIALASSYLYSIEKVSEEETVVVLPVDPYVEDSFYSTIRELEIGIKEGANLALIGIKPTYPSEKYGYIIPRKSNKPSKYLMVNCFHEKPNQEQAIQLIKAGGLWNSGVFAFKLGYIISWLKRADYPVSYEDLLKEYSSLPKISFDYEIVEKESNVVVFNYNGNWKDLGTWNTLTEEMPSVLNGKGIICPESKNTHLINELDIPITILGLSDVVVAASPDGILVADKKHSPRIKEIMGKINHRPMYEERRWGWYKVLDHVKLSSGQEVLTKKIGIDAGKNLSYQIHNLRNEVWSIIHGQGKIALNDIIYPVQAGDVLQIPARAKHALKALTDMELIEIQTGSELIEEDIQRLIMSWEEIELHCANSKI